MLIKTENEYQILDDSEKWLATHDLKGSNGPAQLSYKKDLLIENCGGYIGTVKENGTVPRKIKDYHKAGTSVLEFDGFLPFGDTQANYKQVYRYSNKRLKVTTDVQFQEGLKIPRHFSVGSLFLPGEWSSIEITPPAYHQVHGSQNKTIKVPEYQDKEVMLGHWHRPPLSVVFKRLNGTAIEVGTGSDIWRWEENLNYAPESGSYKIILKENGIYFLREPLACCESVIPEVRPFRFSWYLAWRENGANKKLPKHQKINLTFNEKNELNSEAIRKQIQESSLYSYAVLDIKSLNWNQDQVRILSEYDYIRDSRSTQACWSAKSVISCMKKIIRKLQSIEGLNGIIFKGMEQGYCYCSSHVNKKHENGTAHWDINGLFDFASWASNSCKGKLELFVENDGTLLPSIAGLFE